jgi:accessory gene regulator protein AgrB
VQKYCILADPFLSFQLEENCKNFSLNNRCHAQLVPHYLNGSWMHQLATSLSSQPQRNPEEGSHVKSVSIQVTQILVNICAQTLTYMYVLLVQLLFQAWEVGASIHVFVWIVSEQLEGAMSNHNVYCQGLSSIRKFTSQDCLH